MAKQKAKSVPSHGFPLPAFEKIAKKSSFDSDFKKLSDPVKEEAKKAICEIKSGTLGPGRKAKKRKPKNRNVWQIRLNRGHRMTFQIDGDMVTLRRAANHREIEKMD